MRARSHTSEGKARGRLLAMQRLVREKSELQSSISWMQQKIKVAKARIRELEAALHLESVDAGGESAITAGESNSDIAGKIGGGRGG